METRQTTDLKIVGSTPAKLVFLIKVKSVTIDYIGISNNLSVSVLIYQCLVYIVCIY